MKKAIMTALAVLLVLLLGTSALAASGEMLYVFDLAGLLTYDEWEPLEELAAQISGTHGCGVYVVAAEDYTEFGDGSVYDTAAEIFTAEDSGFGLGEGQDGILLLLSMDERDWALYVHGDAAEYAFGDAALAQLEDSFLPEFGEDDWEAGIDGYLRACDDYLTSAAEGEPVGDDPVASVILAVGVSCVIALLVCLVLKGRMRSVRRGAQAVAYVADGGLKLTEQSDLYTHTTKTVRHIEKNTSRSESGGGGSGRSGKF